MSEYTEVERPFLQQLAAQGWTVIDQGPAVPQAAGPSLRESFRSWWLSGVFRRAVSAINRLPDGSTWLMPRQLDELEQQLLRQPKRTLLEANQAVHELLMKAQVDLNEATGEVDPVVQLIDFHHPERKGEPHLARQVAHHAARIGVNPGGIQIKELGYRWASCTADGVLQFHWKCLMAPPKIVAYIVVHELCHLHHRDHTAAFWNEVDKVMPDYRERKEWLRQRGAEMDL